MQNKKLPQFENHLLAKIFLPNSEDYIPHCGESLDSVVYNLKEEGKTNVV